MSSFNKCKPFLKVKSDDPGIHRILIGKAADLVYKENEISTTQELYYGIMYLLIFLFVLKPIFSSYLL